MGGPGSAPTHANMVGTLIHPLARKRHGPNVKTTAAGLLFAQLSPKTAAGACSWATSRRTAPPTGCVTRVEW